MSETSRIISWERWRPAGFGASGKATPLRYSKACRHAMVVVASLALTAFAYRFLASGPSIENIVPGAWRIDLTSWHHLDHGKDGIQPGSADQFRGIRKIFASNHTFVGMGFPRSDHQGVWATEGDDGIVVRRDDTGQSTIWRRVDASRLREELPDGTIDWVREPLPLEADMIPIHSR